MLEPREPMISGEKSCGSPRTSASGAVTIHGMAVGINNFINKDNAQALIFMCEARRMNDSLLSLMDIEEVAIKDVELTSLIQNITDRFNDMDCIMIQQMTEARIGRKSTRR